MVWPLGELLDLHPAITQGTQMKAPKAPEGKWLPVGTAGLSASDVLLVVTGVRPLTATVCYNSVLAGGEQAAGRMKVSQNHEEGGVGSSSQPCPSAGSIAVHCEQQNGAPSMREHSTA